MPSIRYNANNTEGNHPTSIDIIDAEVKKDDRIVATDMTDLYDVEIAGDIQDGDGLYYDKTAMKWVTGNIISGGGGCNTIGNQDIYIDYTQTDDGNGTEGSPFNTLNSFFTFANSCNRLDDYLTLNVTTETILDQTRTEYLDCQGSHQIDIDLGTITVPVNYYIDTSRYTWLEDSDFRCNKFIIQNTKNIKSITVDLTIEDNGIIGGDVVETFMWVEFFKVACGGYHTAAIHKDRSLWVTGDNTNGQLGFPPGSGEGTQVFGFKKIYQKDGADLLFDDITCGFYHTIGICIDGTMWGTGRNSSNQLGIVNGDGLIKEFTQTGDGKFIWRKVAAGHDHTIAIDKDGVLWGTGDNTYGQLSMGDASNIPKFTQLDVTKNGAPEDGWKFIACGYYTSFAIDKYNRLWVCGYNYNGELGTKDKVNRNYFTLIDYLPDIREVAAGAAHSAVITYDKKLYTTGDNYYGQLGLGDNNDRSEYTFVGYGKYDIDKPEFANFGIEKVVCGGYHTAIAMLTVNTFYIKTAGMNSQGQLGDGTTTHSNVFKSILSSKFSSMPVSYEKPVWLSCSDRGTVINYLESVSNDYYYINNLVVFGSNTGGELGLPDQQSYHDPTKPFETPLMYNGNYVVVDEIEVYRFDYAIFDVINSTVKFNIKGSNKIERRFCTKYSYDDKYIIHIVNIVPIKVTDKSYIEVEGTLNGLVAECSYVSATGYNYTPSWNIYNNSIIECNSYWPGKTMVYNSRWILDDDNMFDNRNDVGYYYSFSPID